MLYPGSLWPLNPPFVLVQVSLGHVLGTDANIIDRYLQLLRLDVLLSLRDRISSFLNVTHHIIP